MNIDNYNIPDGCKEIIENIINSENASAMGSNIQFINFSFEDFKVLFDNGFLNPTACHNSSPSVKDIYDYFVNRDVVVLLEGRVYLDDPDDPFIDFDTILVKNPSWDDINFIVRNYPDEFFLNKDDKTMRGWWD